MTRRTIVFFDEESGGYYATPEFNGDKSEMRNGMDSCDKDWPEIIKEFEGVDSLKKFKAASEKAQGCYHSFLGDQILPVERVGFIHIGAKEIGKSLWLVTE